MASVKMVLRLAPTFWSSSKEHLRILSVAIGLFRTGPARGLQKRGRATMRRLNSLSLEFSRSARLLSRSLLGLTLAAIVPVSMAATINVTDGAVDSTTNGNCSGV